jgi:tetratricopeptide (TPR) repeat protein
MAELSEETHSQIARLCERGDQLAENGVFDEALKLYNAALALLPEPKSDWEATLWIYAAIGDSQFLSRDYASAKTTFVEAITEHGGVGNPFLHLRLGQSLFELDEKDAAAEELTRAYGLEGAELFEEDDVKYLDFLRTKIEM